MGPRDQFGRCPGESSMLYRVSLRCVIASLLLVSVGAALGQERVIVVGGSGSNCQEDPGCINRLHPEIPMAVRAQPGDTLLLHARDAGDFLGTVSQQQSLPTELGTGLGPVHPMAGPVFIEGADAGDVLAVTILNIDVGKYAWTTAEFGFAADLFGVPGMILWELNSEFAVSEGLPGIRIPNASFPGVVTTLPGEEQLVAILKRESELLKAGGVVLPPDPSSASPAALCGPEGSDKDRCLRTIPPREHGGNMDIRYLQTGVTIYLPCYIEGCGLAIGDLHFAQGDGEVSGTAIEMSADIWVRTQIVKDGPDLTRGPHYEGPSTLLDIPSRRFYAVTGFPIKAAGTVPPDMAYLGSNKVSELENLSNDINLATRNALAEMMKYIMETYGYNQAQAYMIASVAVDLRIGQLVDVPNVGVTAILPLDIFEGF